MILEDLASTISDIGAERMAAIVGCAIAAGAATGVIVKRILDKRGGGRIPREDALRILRIFESLYELNHPSDVQVHTTPS